MASERGTMQRGLPNAAPEHPGWPEPTAPSGRRLPSAPRERKPALAALALLLIVGGALGAGFLVLQSGKRVAAIEISHQVGAGQRIPLSDMQQVQVASDTGLNYVPWADASQVAQYYTVTTIPSGTLLSSNMVAPPDAVRNGKDVLGLALKDGQWPDDLTVGDHIAIYSVGSSSAGGCPQAAEQLLSGNAAVLFVSSAGGSGSLVGAAQSGTTDVTVAVNPASAAAVACNAAAGNVAVAVLPAGGRAAPANPPAAAPRNSPAQPKQPAGPSGTPAAGASGTPAATPSARTGHG